MKKLHLLLLLFISFPVFAQTPVFYPSTWPKMLGIWNDTMMNGFCGGFNNPMFYNIDMNGDGIPDLFVYDRCDNSITTFINNGSATDPEYYFDPKYITAYPDFNQNANGWVELYDYNFDGKPDIFAYSPIISTEMQVYKNTTPAKGPLTFTKYLDPVMYNYDPHDTTVPGTAILPIDPRSAPGFGDFYHQGVTDMVDYELGSGSLFYYQNYAKDSDKLKYYPYRDPDSLWFGLRDECWGRFFISNTSSFVSYGKLYGGCDISIALPHKKASSAHIAATTLPIDINGDGDLDLLVGQWDDPHLYYFENGASQNPCDSDSIIAVDTFPFQNAVKLNAMPATYSVDVNNDGIKDLIVSPFEIGSSIVTPDRHNFIWYYKNTGTNKKPNFVLQYKNYMEDNFLDLGIHSAPCFIDYNNDGLPDMIVAHTYKEFPAGIGVGNYIVNGDTVYVSGFDRLALYKNVGTKKKAVFQLVDSDYLSIGEDSLYNVVPTVGDLNGDGKPDIVIGSFNGKLIYFENTKSTGSSGNMQFTRDKSGAVDSINLSPNIRPGNSAPAIGDIDGDGNADLIVGNTSGYLQYYRNIGKSGTPMFHSTPDNPQFGMINTSLITYYHNSPADSVKDSGSVGLSVPCLANINKKKGELDLLIGTNNNGLMLYLNVAGHGKAGDSLIRTDNIIFDEWKSKGSDRYLGGALAPAVALLDDDTMPDVMVGSTRGGLMFFGTKQHAVDTTNYILASIKPVAPRPSYNISVYPNPSTGIVTIKYAGSENLQSTNLTISDITGKLIMQQPLNINVNAATRQINLNNLPQGVYLLNIYTASGERIYYGKVVID